MQIILILFFKFKSGIFYKPFIYAKNDNFTLNTITVLHKYIFIQMNRSAEKQAVFFRDTP